MSENTDIVEDYLKVDKELPGQNYVCLSFVSPNKVLKQKETFYLHKFLQANAEKYGLDESAVSEEYDNFLYKERTELDKEFDKKVDFQTSIRGLKVRGVFSSYKEAEIRSKVLQRMDDVHHIFIGQVGYWLPWDPCADHVQNEEYLEEELNTLMKEYKENEVRKDMFYEEQKREKTKAAMEERLRAEREKKEAEEKSETALEEAKTTLQEEDPWMKAKFSETNEATENTKE